MSCSRLEADIALHAGGDLPAGRAAQIEAQLGECADCRALLDELRANQALLSELQDEKVDESVAADVRRRVLATVDARKPGLARRYWKPALAAGLALAAISVFSWRTEKPRQLARVEPPAPKHTAPTSGPAIVPARHPVIRRRRRVPMQRAHAPMRSAPLLVQFVTDDPNIVIYWVVDHTPEGD
jgi:hypothetical protein